MIPIHAFGANQKLVVCRVGFLLPFGKKKSWCNHAILVFVFDVNLIAFGVLYNFSHPLPGEFHKLPYSTRSTLEYPLKIATSQKEEITEQNKNREWNMDSKKNKTYFLIQVTLPCLTKGRKCFLEESIFCNLQGILMECIVTSSTSCWFSHDVTKIQTTKLSILLRFYFHGVLEQLQTNFQTNFCFKRVLGFVIKYAWISKLLRDAAFTWRPRELSFRLKKWLFLRNFAI